MSGSQTSGKQKSRKKSGKSTRRRVDPLAGFTIKERGPRLCFLFLNFCGFRWGLQLGPLEAVIESRFEKSIGQKKLNCLSDPETPYYFHPLLIQCAILSPLWRLVKSLFII